jgi:AraC-like DNA-binding protein
MDEQIKNLYNLDVLDLGLTIFDGGRTLCRAGNWSSPGEWIHQARLYHPVSGQGWVEIGGEVTRLRAGQLYLIPPHAKLSYGTPSQIVIEWLHFRFQSAVLDIRLGSVSKVRHFGKEVAGRWVSVCRLIERFMRDRSTHDAFRIHAMLMELVGIMLMSLSPENSRVRLARERLAPALQFLDVHAIKHPSLREVARTVHLSSEHFHRLFQATFHTTPHQYAQARRMVLAKSLLAEGLLSVTEVAERCGYGEAFYFSRVFRRYFGASPGRVRRGLVVLGREP